MYLRELCFGPRARGDGTERTITKYHLKEPTIREGFVDVVKQQSISRRASRLGNRRHCFPCCFINVMSYFIIRIAICNLRIAMHHLKGGWTICMPRRLNAALPEEGPGSGPERGPIKPVYRDLDRRRWILMSGVLMSELHCSRFLVKCAVIQGIKFPCIVFMSSGTTNIAM